MWADTRCRGKNFVPLAEVCRLQQYRQCTCNVTLKPVYETIVAVEKQQVLYIAVCTCVRARVCVDVGALARACSCARVNSLIQHAKHPPYCHLRPLWLSHIFRH